MIRPTRLLAAAATAGLALSGALATATPASADHAGDPTIHPGVQTYTAGAQCTANFVFTDGLDTFIGQAAHCSGTGGNTETNGCSAGSLPLGTPVEVNGATQPGTLVYNSWLTMQARGETDPSTCPTTTSRSSSSTRPTPVASARDPGHRRSDRHRPRRRRHRRERLLATATAACAPASASSAPKEGVSLGTEADGWNHPVYTLTPGIPGDCGSAFVNADGEALGVLSTLALAPLAGSNGVSDLGKALDYANAFGGVNVSLSLGEGTPSTGASLGGILG